MNRGCSTLFGLGFLSLFVFGVTLEALNEPKELSATPFKPWDFLTYGLIALGILLLIRIVRKPDPRKTLAGKWTSDGLRSLRDHISCEVEPFKLPRGFFGEFEPTHGCLPGSAFAAVFALIFINLGEIH